MRPLEVWVGFGDMFDLLLKRCKGSSGLGHPGVLEWLLRELGFYMFVLLHNLFCGTLIALCIIIHIALWL